MGCFAVILGSPESDGFLSVGGFGVEGATPRIPQTIFMFSSRRMS